MGTLCSNLQRVAFPVLFVPTVPFFPWRFKPPRVVRWGPESSSKDTCWNPFKTFSARRNSNALQHEGDDNNNNTTNQSSCTKIYTYVGTFQLGSLLLELHIVSRENSESEIFMRKSQTETLPCWLGKSDVSTARSFYEFSHKTKLSFWRPVIFPWASQEKRIALESANQSIRACIT